MPMGGATGGTTRYDSIGGIVHQNIHRIAVAAILAIFWNSAFLFIFTGCMSQQASGPKHVILLSVDTLRRDHLGCYGNPGIFTPNIDRLARKSVQFHSAIAPMGRTNPSFATLHTGLYPRDHGVTSLFRRLPDRHTTLAERFQTAGFTTAFINANPMLDEDSGLHQGFDTYYMADQDTAEPPERINQVLMDEHTAADKSVSRHFSPDRPKSGWLTHVYEVPDNLKSKQPVFQYAAEYVTDTAIRHMDSLTAEDQTFLWLLYMDPHWPYEAPSPWNRLHESAKPEALEAFEMLPMPDLKFHNTMSPESRDYLRNQYRNEVEYTDHHIGRLLRYLAEQDLMADTLIVFVSDHGESLGEHGVYFCHGDVVYQDNIRVPFMLHGPGAPDGTGGSLTDRRLSMNHVAREILDRTVKLNPILNGENRNYTADPDTVFAMTGSTSLKNPRSYYDDSRGRWHTVIQDDYKLIYIPHPENDIWELYDLSDDPGERLNLTERGVPLEPVLRRRLEQWDVMNFEEPDTVRDVIPEDPAVIQQLKNLGYID